MNQSTLLGAPKVVSLEQANQPELDSVRMDTCAFIGVAPKGPARRPRLDDNHCFSLEELEKNWHVQARTVATPVNSWDEYIRFFGGFEGPGRLAYAVAQFFEQGGKRAYVGRIVPEYSDNTDYQNYLASAELSSLTEASGPVRLTAKNEGSWANGLSVAVGFTFRVVYQAAGSNELELRLNPNEQVSPGDLLRMVNNDPSHPLDNYATYRFVTRVSRIGLDSSEQSVQVIDYRSSPLPAPPTQVQLVLGQCIVQGRDKVELESFEQLGFSPLHPRFLAKVLFTESSFLDPVKVSLLAECLPPDIDPYVNDFFPYQASQQLFTTPAVLSGGIDNYQDITHQDFFDAGWELRNERAGDGIHCLALLADCAMLVIPDLYVPEVFEVTSREENTIPERRAEFAPCIEYQVEHLQVEHVQASLPGLTLDPLLELDAIIYWQQQAVYFVEARQGMMLLLDVPPRLNFRQVMEWRNRFNSRVCAAYHPWLKVTRVSPFDQFSQSLMAVNPSAVAAGVIAATELRLSLGHGPANRLLKAVTALDIQVGAEQHNAFHPAGINVLRQQRDGIWLTGARTLSRDKQWCHVSVVRLLQMLKASLYQHMQWLVFEPNSSRLWQEVRFSLRTFLRRMYLAGAFKGESEQQAFFVRCDESTNPRQIVDAGKLVALVGVALVEPVEFITLQITRQADGALALEVQ